jgi:hypothetical protein
MKKYIVKDTNTGYCATFCYRDSDGLLIAATYPENADDNKLKAFMALTCRTFPELLERIGNYKSLKIAEDIDLSFESFWNKYTYKVGAKEASKKLWGKLTDDEKYAAISKIKEYDKYIVRTGIAKVYPERYLKHRRWENEFM